MGTLSDSATDDVAGLEVEGITLNAPRSTIAGYRPVSPVSYNGTRLSAKKWCPPAGLAAVAGTGSYRTAWTMLRKLRSAMVRPARERLSGTVEVDETCVGGIAQGTRGRGAERKFIVVIAIESLDPKGSGCIRLRRVEDVPSASLIPFFEYAVEPGSEVRTDAWYRLLENAVVTKPSRYRPSRANLPTGKHNR